MVDQAGLLQHKAVLIKHYEVRNAADVIARRNIGGLLRIDFQDQGTTSHVSGSFGDLRRSHAAGASQFIKWTQALPLPPGLYQVRIAVRNRQDGRTGSAMTWIEIPLH